MMEYVKPLAGPLSEFPKDMEVPEGAEVVKHKDQKEFGPVIYANVVYDRQSGVDLHLQVLVPEHNPSDRVSFPLIVYIPGSAWMKQSVFNAIPMLLWVCAQGYTIAVVEYRDTGIAGFPAQVEDAKTAIRFMKIHAEEFSVDPEKVAVWGDSSGGHTALMAGFTIDSWPDNGRYGEVSSSVGCIVDWYGPTDLMEMNAYPSLMDHTEPASPEGRLIGFKNVLENPDLAAKASPIHYVSPEKPVPPVLIMHGNRDQLVCYQQSVELYNKMKACGKEVEMMCLDGAYHGFGGFRSEESLISVEWFIGVKLGVIQDEE